MKAPSLLKGLFFIIFCALRLADVTMVIGIIIERSGTGCILRLWCGGLVKEIK
jgi:hypothetical protein